MKTILIVDDNPTNMKLFRIIIKSINYNVIEAVDGLDGIEKAKHYRPDLILMDIQLPKMDGIEAFKKIKSIEECSSIPIIAITSYAIKGDQDQLIKVGFSDYLSKPIDKKKFINSINNFLA